MSTFVIGYRPRTIAHPSKLPERHQVEALQLLDRVIPVTGELEFSHVTDYDDPFYGVDLETSWEELLQLDAALQAFPSEQVILQRVTADMEQPPTTVTGQITEVPEGAVWFGSEPGSVNASGCKFGRTHRFPYWEYETFRKHAGRQFMTAGVEPDDGTASDADAALSMGHFRDRFFVKSATTKQFAGASELHGSLGDLDDPPRLLGDGMWDSGLWMLEGHSNTLLVQQFVDMRFEYRFWVADGRILAGAAPVEWFTPFNGRGEVLDTRLVEVRGSGEDVVERPDVVDELHSFAADVAAEFHAEDPDLELFVLDVAMGPDGPLVVELNEPGAAGLYAADPVRIATGFREVVESR